MEVVVINTILYNRDIVWEKNKGSKNRYNEAEYEDPVIIKGIRYGSSEYKRDLEESSVDNLYMYQTTVGVEKKDKLDGYIVTSVNEYDFLGVKYREVGVDNA